MNLAGPSDHAARQQALDPSASFIVRAPAGSGKTGLLVQRFLCLLAGVKAPESVVAVTFTKKAVAEMRARVVEALTAAQGPRPESAHDALTWELARQVLAVDAEQGWNLLHNPARLRIRTFDGLAHWLDGRMPYLSRLGAAPNVADKAERLYGLAAERVLAHLDRDGEDGKAISTVFTHLDNDTAYTQKLLMQMLATRDQWLRHLIPATHQAGAIAFIASLETALAQAVAAVLARVQQQFESSGLADELAMWGRYAARHLADQPESPIVALADEQAFPSDPAQVGWWHGLSALLLTKSGTVRKGPNKAVGFPSKGAGRNAEESARFGEAVTSMKALMARLDEPDLAVLVDGLNEVITLPPPSYPKEQRDALEALPRVLMLAVAELWSVFAEEGQVDHPEVAQRAIMALGSDEAPTDLALLLDHTIDHLLVDEFQDTSFAQYQLIARLTAGWSEGDGRSLFLVGDPMQSIYRFREADVALYLTTWEQQRLGSIPLTPLQLRANFRSRPAVVNWINRMGEECLPEQADLLRGRVPFARCDPARAEETGSGVTVYPDSRKDPAVEADKVVAIIQQAHEADAHHRVAILIRARSHLAAILPALERHGIAYRAVDIDSLADRPVVRDLTALTRALLDPADRIAWLAVLRAPMCGLSLADLLALAKTGERRQPIATVLARSEPWSDLSDDGQQRLQRCWPVLREALSRRGHVRLMEWVSATWNGLNGPACLSPDDLTDAERLLGLLEGLSDVPDPVARLTTLVDGLFAQPVAPQQDGPPPVEIMTIHKAKGLEFDTVILPGLGRSGRSEDRKLLVWLNQPMGGGDTSLLMAPLEPRGDDHDLIYDWLRGIQKQQGDAERQRLLYVAVTRARSHLHLLGVAQYKDGEITPRSGSLLAELWPVVSAEYERFDPPEEAANEDLLSSRLLTRLKVDWQAPPPAPPVALPLPPPRSQEVEPTFDWAGAPARAVGIVVHRAFELIATTGLSGWDRSRVADQAPRYRAALAAQGLTPEQQEVALGQVVAAVQMALDDSRGRWLLTDHEEARSELEVTGWLSRGDGPPVRQQRTLDRTFVADGVRWIVDFKTGRHSGTDVGYFLDEEQRRYRPQLEGYARLMAKLDVQAGSPRPIRLGLYFPLLAEWREWGWDEQ